jgi:Ca2+:H+ antiporter
MAATRTRHRRLSTWCVVVPTLAAAVLVLTWSTPLTAFIAAIVAIVLVSAVLAAVHHAEVVALRVGEPYGSLILAVAVTVIEVGLIVSLMVSSPETTSALARDTVFAAIMITMNGILGVSILVAVARHGLTPFNAEGSGAALASVATLAALTLVLPNFTSSEPGPVFSGPQLVFAALASLTIYGVFVLTQTRQHRDFFLPVLPDGVPPDADDDPETHAAPPTGREAAISLVLLIVSLTAVVGLAKVESPAIESLVGNAGMPQAVVGVIIALVILLPESLAAARAARRGRLQTSINLAFGSALASIGLTIPALAVASIWLEGPLQLGLGPTQIVLLALTLFVAALTVIPGRVTRLQGAMHVVILAAFLVLSVNP